MSEIRGKLFLVMFAEDEDCRACDLRDAGWFVDAEYEDGGLAFRVIRQDPPDAVVIDLDHKPSHGREVARALQNTRATRQIPVIGVGGTSDARARLQAVVPTATFCSWEQLPDTLAGLIEDHE
ncbi:MAG: hypothetical protein Kow0077_09310 [Anaerolineae bacterium]